MASRQREYEQGDTFSGFLADMGESRHPWGQFYRRARIPEDIGARLAELQGRWRLLVLCEEWCGDGANIVPYLARAVEGAPNLEMRILARDEHPELMDAHLTSGNRSIPVVMILDEDYREVSWWGPRPAPLQELFLEEIRPLPADERYPRVRAWYARDRGRTTLSEILDRIPASAERAQP